MGGSGSKSTEERQSAPPPPPKQQSQITSSDKARLQLKMCRDNLDRGIRKHERIAEMEHQKAREFLQAGNKRKALYCLKREKIQQSQIESVMAMLDNVQHLIDTVEFTSIESEVVSAMKDGKNELDRLNALLNIDDIEKLMDETSESIEEANAINAVLSQPIAGIHDDDELLAELEGQMGGKQENAVTEDIQVPNHKLPESKKVPQQKEGPSDEGESPVRQYA